jgi:hypothetical protein
MTGDPHQLVELSKSEMQALIDARLAKPGSIYLPLGKRKAFRGPKPVYENEFVPQMTAEQAKARKADLADKKLGSLLNYYAGTSVPFSRIAEHLKLDLETVQRAMLHRGRSA